MPIWPRIPHQQTIMMATKVIHFLKVHGTKVGSFQAWFSAVNEKWNDLDLDLVSFIRESPKPGRIIPCLSHQRATTI